MSHLRSLRGDRSRSRSIFELKLFDLNLGPTLSPVPSISHFSSLVGGQVWIQLQFHLFLTSGDCGGQLQIQLQIHILVVIFYLNFGSTPAGPTYVSPKLIVVGGQLWIQLQIHICVVLFELNLGGGFKSGSISCPIFVSPHLIVGGLL